MKKAYFYKKSGYNYKRKTLKNSVLNVFLKELYKRFDCVGFYDFKA